MPFSILEPSEAVRKSGNILRDLHEYHSYHSLANSQMTWERPIDSLAPAQKHASVQLLPGQQQAWLTLRKSKLY